MLTILCILFVLVGATMISAIKWVRPVGVFGGGFGNNGSTINSSGGYFNYLYAKDSTIINESVINLNVTGQILGNTEQWNRSGTNVYLSNTDDRVGVGTKTPDKKLQVDGTAKATKLVATQGHATIAPTPDEYALVLGNGNEDRVSIQFNSTSGLLNWSVEPDNGWLSTGKLGLNLQGNLLYLSSLQSLISKGGFWNRNSPLNLTGTEINFYNSDVSGTKEYDTTVTVYGNLSVTDKIIADKITSTDSLNITSDKTLNLFSDDLIASGHLSDELITNGDMGSSSGWSVGSGWSISGGVATKSTGGSGDLQQTSANMVEPLIVGEDYFLSYSFRRMDSVLTNLGVDIAGNTDIRWGHFTNDTYYAQFTALSTGNLKFDCSNTNQQLIIDNVSLRRVLKKDHIITGNLGIGNTQPTAPLTIFIPDNGNLNPVGIELSSDSQQQPRIDWTGGNVNGDYDGGVRWDASNTRFVWSGGGFSVPENSLIFWGGASAPGGITLDYVTGLLLTGRGAISFSTFGRLKTLLDSTQHAYGANEDTLTYFNGRDYVIDTKNEINGNVLLNGDTSILDTISLGSELVTNGDFSVGGSWTLGSGWSIVGGGLNKTSAGQTTASQTITGLTPGKSYLLTYNHNYVKSMNHYLLVSFGNFYYEDKHGANTGYSERRYIIKATSTSHDISFTSFNTNANNQHSIDDVSIKEINYGDLRADDLNLTGNIEVEGRGYIKDSIFYNVTNVTHGGGSEGNLNYLSNCVDDQIYNITENAGGHVFNFTGVESFKRIHANLEYDGSTSHYMIMNVYNHQRGVNVSIRELKDGNTENYNSIFIDNDHELISNAGMVSIIFTHPPSVNPTHQLRLNCLRLER